MLLQILLKMVNCWDEAEDEAAEEAEDVDDGLEGLDADEVVDGEQQGEEQLGAVDEEGPPPEQLPGGTSLSRSHTSPSPLPSPAASCPLPSRQPSTSAHLLTTASCAAGTSQEQGQVRGHGQGQGQGRAQGTHHSPVGGHRELAAAPAAPPPFLGDPRDGARSGNYGGDSVHGKLDAQYHDSPPSSPPPVPPSRHGPAAAAPDLNGKQPGQAQLGAQAGMGGSEGPAGAAEDSGGPGAAPALLPRVPTLRRPSPATSSPAHHSVRLMCFNYGVMLSSVPGLREALRTAQDAVLREEEEQARQLAVGKVSSSWLGRAQYPADAIPIGSKAGWGLGLRLRRHTSSARGGQAGSPRSTGASGKRRAAGEAKEVERGGGDGGGAEGEGSFSADGAVAVELGSMDGRSGGRERDRTAQQQQQQPVATTHRGRDAGCGGITFDVLFRTLMERYAMVSGRGGLGHGLAEDSGVVYLLGAARSTAST